MNPTDPELTAIERNLDVPRGTLRRWLSEGALRGRTRGATESRGEPRGSSWRTYLDLF